MKFVRAIWKLLVGVKDALVLLLLLVRRLRLILARGRQGEKDG